MKKEIVKIGLAAALAAFVLAGCGKRAGEGTASSEPATTAQTGTEKKVQIVTESEAVTEAVTEAKVQTVKKTPVFTEPATENVTEAVTESETVKTYPDLSESEEKEKESEFDAPRTYYAKDDMNIRQTPSTESSENIISSFDQGEKVTVTGETPSWYVISKADGDDTLTGYVHKDTLSETVVEPKSEEERAKINAQYADGGQDTSDHYSVTTNTEVNIRSDASVDSDAIGSIPEGATVTVTGSTEDGWLQVTYDGTSGYINANLVSNS